MRLLQRLNAKHKPSRLARSHLKRSLANATYQTLEPRQLLATLSSFSVLSHGETLGYIANDSTAVASGAIETYTVNLRAQQNISIRVVANDTLSPTISVSDPNGANLGTDGSGANAATLQSLPVDTAGDYVISVSGFNSTAGGYEITVLINATFESEVGDGNANETLETAEPITGWVDPGSYLATPANTDAEIATTYGSFVDEGVITSDDFETGSLDARWTTSSSTTNGNIQVTNALGSSSGAYSLVMSSDVDGTDNLNEAILDLGFAGIVPFLSFSYTQWNDEIDALPNTFSGSVNGDGVSISDDGVEWHTIYNATPVTNGEWGEAHIDLYQAALDANLDRNNLLVKFQQFGDSSLLNDGRAYDNIRSHDLYFDSNNFNTIPIAYDWYSFEVTEPQSISIATRRTNARRVIDNQVPGAREDFLSRTRIALLDADGNVLEDPDDLFWRIESYNYDSRIDNYQAAPGTYYVRVDGAGFEEYALSITRNLDLPPTDLNGAVAGDFISSLSVGQSTIVENEFWSDNTDISSWSGHTLQEPVAGGPIFHVNTNGAFQPSTGDGVYASAVDSPEGFQEGINEFRADFNNLARKVMIDVGSDDAGDSAFLRAYSAAGVLLEEVTSGLIPHSNFETLTIDRPTADIAYIVAAGTDGDPTPLDHLEFFESGLDAKRAEFQAVAGETIVASLAVANALPSNPDLTGDVEIQLWHDGNLLSTGTDSIVHVAPTTGSYRVWVRNTADDMFGGFYLRIEKLARASVTDAGVTYKGSAWDDGSDLYASLPTDKSIFFNGQTAGFQNYTTYAAGINNILVGVFQPSPYLTVDDFSFKVGASDDTSTWADAPTPTMTINPPAFDGGSSTISFDWPDGTITNTWLQVKAIASPLSAFANDVTFYLGNVIGDTGNSPTDTIVNLVDVGLTRQNQSGFLTVPIDNVFDFNRDKRVNLIDVAIARFNQSGLFALPLITPFENSNISAKSTVAANTPGDVIGLPRSFSFTTSALTDAMIEGNACLRSKVESTDTPEPIMSSTHLAIQTAPLPEWFERNEQRKQNRVSRFQPANIDALMESVVNANEFEPMYS